MNHAPYDELVGGAFASLPDGVRRAHSFPLHARGRIQVVRGSGLAGLVAGLFRLPRSGRDVDTRLQISADSGALVWTRHFDGRRVETRQWAEEGRLMEANGRLRVAFDLRTSDGQLVYESRAAWLGPFRLPIRWSPHLSATVREAAGGWHVDVRIDHEVLGLLCRYYGIMRQV